ncbi:MAG: tetratricopeptide repeat protein [Acidobacteriota bacterium]|nr:tetratricopeptide repeat protein [Acidobacteriota bacterium]
MLEFTAVPFHRISRKRIDASMARKKKKATKPKARTAAPKSGFQWTDRRFTLALFVGALLLRLIYIVEISGTPMAGVPIGDGESYDLWARDIAAGNWLGSEIFYAAPLYPYFLGVLYAVFGPNLIVVRCVQALMGAAACLMIRDASARFFDEKTGRLAGVLTAIYPTAVYFDGLIQKTSLAFFLFSCLLFILGRLKQQPGPQLTLAAGLLLGLMGITRENALILLPVLLLWFWVVFSKEPPVKRAAYTALLPAGLILVVLPVTIRNQVVAGEFTLTTSNLGTNLWIGNNPEADGCYAPLRFGRSDWKFERLDATELAEEEAGRDLTPAGVSAFWRDKTLSAIADDPGRWLMLMGRKMLLVWNAVEIADTEDIYTYSGWSVLLGLLLLVFHFGILCPLAAFGIWQTRTRWRELWPLYLIAAAYAGSVVLFFIFDRFRFPVVGVLLPFAAAGLVTLRDSWSNRRNECLIGLGIALAVAIMTNLPLLPRADFTANSHVNVGNVLAREGDYQGAVAEFEKALAANPNLYLARIALGNAYVNTGQVQKALPHLQKAVDLNPNAPQAQSQLGLVQLVRGETRKAVASFRKAVTLDPDLQEALNNLAWVLATDPDETLRDGAEAVALAERARDLSQGKNAGYLDTLAAAYARAGRFQDAVAAAEQAIALAEQQGDRDKAQKIKARLTLYGQEQAYESR